MHKSKVTNYRIQKTGIQTLNVDLPFLERDHFFSEVLVTTDLEFTLQNSKKKYFFFNWLLIYSKDMEIMSKIQFKFYAFIHCSFCQFLPPPKKKSFSTVCQ